MTTGWSAELTDFERQRLAERQALAEAHAALPVCIAPDCQQKAPYVFIAQETGRLAGRQWRHGDEIRLCPAHASDIYKSQSAYSVDDLAEWLRADAFFDPLDAYDAEADSIHGAEIARARRRRLHVAGPR